MSDEMITVFMKGGEFVDRQAFIDMRNRWSLASEEIVKQKDRIEGLEAALRKIAKSGVIIHSGWGWIQVEAQKALGESE